MKADAEQGTRQTALVTGGAKGIGRAVVLALAERGYKVAIIDILDEAGRETAQRASALGADCRYYRADVADEACVTATVGIIRQQMGEPDVLVNNAGIYPRCSAVDMPYALWQHVLAVNLGGAFLCSRTVAPIMLRRGGGIIVNVASGRALQGAAGGSHYAASKAGVLSLTRSLALEWAPTLRVNAVIPGVTDTDPRPKDTPWTDWPAGRRGTGRLLLPVS